MSLNKVLNRPLFRNVALKKGHLKPIHAQDGVMVGSPYGSSVPKVIPGQGVFSPVNTQSFGPPKPTRMQNIMRNPVVRFGKGIANIPAYLGFEGSGAILDAGGMQNSPLKAPIQIASAIGANYLPGAAALGSIGFLPSAVGIATLAGIQNRFKAGRQLRQEINKMSPEERAEFARVNRLKATDIMSEGVSDTDLFGKFVPKPIEEKVAEDKKIVDTNPAAGRPSMRFKPEELKAEGDPLLQDNVATDDVADLDAVQENSVNVDSTSGPPEGPGDTSDAILAAKEDTLTKAEKKNIQAQNNAQSSNQINLGGPSSNPDFNKTIALAKQYEEAVYKGEGSQAGLVFLSNLASGLLTGTTKRRGLGGAMEVFGQAIGPAVNNYATIKLKEGELRQNRRAKSLEAAMDHMKFLNDAARVERPDVTPGVVQIRGVNGDLQNYNGYIGKDGTTYLPGGLGQDGRQSLTPIAQGGVLKDSGPDGKLGTEDDISLGRFEKFLKQDKISSRLSDIEDTLGNRYTAYSVTLDILDTIKQTDAEGNLVSPGVGLTLDTYARRIGNAAKDLIGRDIVAENLEVAKADLQTLYEDEVDMINKDPNLSEKEKENEIAMIDKDKLYDQILKDKKGVGWFSGLSAKDQEKLAVQETSLVYALANTFKDQDRLTQRDINAAREIVNLFALGRGGQDVRDSIEAIAGQLRADIRRQELLYTSSGGLYSTIQDLKELEGYDSSVADEKVKEAFGLTKEQIKNELGKMEL